MNHPFLNEVIKDLTFWEVSQFEIWMVLFLTMTGRDVYAKEYLSDVGSEAYARHSKMLLLREQKAQPGQEIRLALS